MKLKFFIVFSVLFFAKEINAQKKYNHSGIYTAIGYEFGFLFSDIKETTIPFTNNTINNNFNHSLSITGLYKTAFNTEIKLGYMTSYSSLTIEGSNNNKSFIIDNNYFTHTFFIGGGYNFVVKDDIDITIGLGSAVTYIKKAFISENEGEVNNQIVATNNSIKRANVYLVPEISMTKHLKNGNTLTIGSKYYHSANDFFMQGSVENKNNGIVIKKVNFSTQNNQIAFYLNYGFNLSKLF
ncbi:hypothetical protein [Tenacibaculum sp. nBUS_03]|uniref:hypothetical protein n=1 Tax=Tenacibaculum sp. nBUS_03 TaxID=3395320 RepID=UPI003EBF502C